MLSIFETKSEQLESKMPDDWNVARRIQYNKRLIGRKIYALNYSGWYGIVKDLIDVDDFIVARPSGKEFVVNIHDIRQLEEDIVEEVKKETVDEFSLKLL